MATPDAFVDSPPGRSLAGWAMQVLQRSADGTGCSEGAGVVLLER